MSTVISAAVSILLFLGLLLVLKNTLRQILGQSAVRVIDEILSTVLRLVPTVCQISVTVVFWLIAVLVKLAFPKSDPSKYLNGILSALLGGIASLFSGFGSAPRIGSGREITDMWKDKTFEEGKSVLSNEGLSTLIGWTVEGRQGIWFELGDAPPHCVLAGGTGSGKSNVLNVLIHGLLHRYSPDELNLCLLDYKDGVEFNVYAQAKIPQVKFVATVNDSEYGITVLKHFQAEITRRNDQFKKSGAKDIGTMRQITGKSIPRILLIIDEFQVLINDASVTEQAYELFSDILKRGRSAGIHVLLATQSLSGLRGSMSGGFDTLKTQLGYRIALKCNQQDSRTILSLDNAEASTLIAKKEAICNKDDGNKESNIKIDVPYADPAVCAKHLQDISTHIQRIGYVAETKIFDGNCLPDVPSLKQFSKFKNQILLGERLTFEAGLSGQFTFEPQPFTFQWNRKQEQNLCVVGRDEKIREGILTSVLLSIRRGDLFDRVIYYNSNPNWNNNFSGFTDVEVKNYAWDCNIVPLVSGLSAKRTLLIIDSLDNAGALYPKKKEFVPKTTPTTPADFLKEFLAKGPISGSYVLAFADSWTRFNDSNNDYKENFEFYIGFGLNEDEAGSLATGNIGRPLRGLTKPDKALFVDRQQSTQTVFRPFVE